MLPEQRTIKKQFLKSVKLLRVKKNFFQSPKFFLRGLLFIVFLVHLPKLFKGLNEIHGFRQTQTAFGIKYFTQDSLNPFNATLPISGPGSKIPLEFPLFQLTASIPARITGDYDFSARFIGLLSFMLCVYLLFKLVINIFNEDIAKITTILFSFSPLGLQWAASSLIEYMAVAFSLVTTLALIMYLKTNKMHYLGLFFIALTVSMLVKITTAIGWILAVLIILYLYSTKIRIKNWFSISCILIFSLVIFIFWVIWSDRVKSGEEWWAPGLTSYNLRPWNFGTVEMRLEILRIYDVVEKISQPTVGGVGIFTILVIYSLSKIRSKPFLSPFLAVTVTSPIIFFPLFNHSYYAISISPAIALLCGNLINDLVSKVNTQFLITSLIIFVSFSTNLGILYAGEYFNFPKPPLISTEINTIAQSDANIMLRCNDDWSSEYLYYAEREGLMLRYNDIIPSEKDWGSAYQYLAFCDESNVDLGIVPNSVYVEEKTKLLYKIHRK